MTKGSAVAKLRALDAEIVKLSHIMAVLEWDLETGMPEAAEAERSEQLSLIARMIHDRITSHEMGDTIALAVDEAVTQSDSALVRVREKEYFESVNIPSDLVAALSEAKGKAHGAWLKARECDDWSLFQPHLENLVHLSIEREKAKGSDASPYDSMLSHYEAGMSVSILDPIFSFLENGMHSLLDKLSNVRVDTSFLYSGYDKGALLSFCDLVMTKMGFDWKRGGRGLSPHPFTSTLGRDDIRITNRFTDKGLFDPISSVIHETGHALYEQNASLNEEIRGTSLSGGASMGVHESQSRFWENVIGRNPEFWKGLYPVLQDYMPSLKAVKLDDFIRAVDFSEPSPIRVNADELTYSLHIIVRYEVEKAMISSSVSFSDLPSYWNELSEKILRYRPRNNEEGILQDCHWAGGDFGYFPSYAIGNIYASQFFEAMNNDLGSENVTAALLSCDYSPITAWQSRNIWSLGAIYEPADLVKRVTGHEIDASCYMNYLEKRFVELYL